MRMLTPLLLLAVLVASAQETDPASPDLKALCSQLGNDSFDIRDAAHRKLLLLGKAVKQRLQALLAASDDAEVKWRAKTIIHEINEREHLEELFGRGDGALTEEQLEEAPAIAGRLESGGVQHRNSVYEGIGPKDLPRVVEAMRAWMRRNPQDGQVAYNLGYTLYWMERYGEAAAVWLYTETIAPDEERAFNDAANAFEADGRYQEAAAQYEKTMKRFPDFAHPVSNMGSLCITMGDHKRALELWQQSKDLRRLGDSGTNFEAVLGGLLADNGKLDEAEERFKAAFKRTGEEVYAYGNRYDMLYDQGRFEELKQLVKNARQAAPNNSDITELQALCANLFGDSAEALKIHEDVIALHGDTASMRRRKAHFLICARQYDQAEPLIKQLLLHNARDARALSIATDWARATKHWAEAVEYATARAEMLPRVPYAHSELAAIYAAADDPKIRNLQRAGDLAKVTEQLMAGSYYYGSVKTIRAELNAELSYVYEAQGNRAEALKRHQEYAELFVWRKGAQERLEKLKAAAEEQQGKPPAKPNN